MTVQWPTDVDEVICGDQVVAVAAVTPARGVVISPMTNFAVHDRQAGVVRVNSSVGASKKVARIRANPSVALAFHSRTYSDSGRSEYVLVQGSAKVLAPVENFPSTIGRRWDDKDGPPPSGLLAWWLRTYYTRVPIDISVQRVIVWSDLTTTGMPLVYGPPLPPPVSPQTPPTGGTAPRIDLRRAGARVSRLNHVLLGWVGDDGFPMVVPVGITQSADNGLRLTTTSPMLPPGGRRAGLTAHSFRHQHSYAQRIHTGWLEVEPTCHSGIYRPHSEFGFSLPPSRMLYRLLVGYSARRGARNSAPA